MSTTDWVLLQVWVGGCVAGLTWLVVAWIGKRWERLAQRTRSCTNGRRQTEPAMSVMRRACPECVAAGGEPHLQPCQHAKRALSRQLSCGR